MNITKTAGYSSFESNDYTYQFETKLLSYASTQAKQNGLEDLPGTEPELRLLIMNHIETETQAEIENNNQQHTPVCKMVLAKKSDSESQLKSKEISADLKEDEHKMAEAESIKKQEYPNIRTVWVRRFIYCIVAFLSAMEGIYIYEALRSISFPKVAACMSAIALGLGLAILTHIAAKYIKNAISKEQRLYRYRMVILPAFIGFFFIGYMRAKAYTTQAALDAKVHRVLEPHSISGFGVTVICFLTFLLGLFISVKYAKTKAEELKQKDYEKACREHKKYYKAVAQKRQQITNIQRESNEKTEEALSNLERAAAIENQLKTIAQKAMNIYAATNIRHRKNGIIPHILTNPPAFQFTTFFENIHTK